MMPPLAKQGYPVIRTVVLCTALLLFFSVVTHGTASSVLSAASAVALVFLCFTLYFFRDPERSVPYDPGVLISPADGTVLFVDNVSDSRFPHGIAGRVAIFMSVFNVHVNRSPIDATVTSLHYNRGKYISAFREKASQDNESLFVVLQGDNPKHAAGVHFIAGLIARRIVFYKDTRSRVQQGERINIIKFGSRVDLYCPAGTEILVKKGDRVKAGETVLARFSDE